VGRASCRALLPDPRATPCTPRMKPNAAARKKMEPLQHETYIRDPTPLGFRIAPVSGRLSCHKFVAHDLLSPAFCGEL
jgi:hypothetical protein